MNKADAIKILTDVANIAQKNGLLGDIMYAGTVYTALVVLSQDIPMPEDEVDGPTNQASNSEEN